MTPPTPKAPAKAAVTRFRAAQYDLPWRPYDALRPEDRTSAEIVDGLLTDGWKYMSRPLIALRPPIEWSAADADRSASFQLHAWHPLGPILARYEATRDGALLRFALDVALDWIATHPSVDDESAFAWNGMVVGLRAYRLAYLTDVAARLEEVPDADVRALLGAVDQHFECLADEEQFQSHSNQGFFQAAGEIVLALRLPGLPQADQALSEGEARLHQLFDDQFAPDGVHLEHSPGYHQTVLDTVERLVANGIGDTLRDRREGIEDALAWMVLPNGTLATIGDTDPRAHLSVPTPDLVSPHLRHMLSDGEHGALPSDAVRGFPESGYVMFRSEARASYLMQICGFHSRAHKHADDLSFVWYDRGTELLVDAGRYGYLGKTEPGSELFEQGFWYDDPARVYVESTAAHNTVEIDGRSHLRRGVRPYGSALQRWGESDGLLYAESTVRHRRSILHSRVLVLDPGNWLIVYDALADTTGEPHDYVQRFHFGPELDAAPLGDGISLTVPGQASPLYALPILDATLEAPVRGQEEPLLGWISRRHAALEPVWTGGFAARGVSDHVFATLFAFGDSKPRVHRDSRANVSGRRARLIWSVGDRAHQIDLNRESGDFGLSHRNRRIG